ncbi:GbsR/MarR family transcriptional regulator [Actinorugispora endophytica]|uniref:MarR family protein n=1 Tax=Actinorugispora endophytica TaxID=1605990 RepID=A0A4R6V5V7_9ACTN|nr:MarR family transcriptional regulator [Actinorugispora endophytica]TDQ54225.1 MarR family protein [Actinorugispora endophytica]
MPDDAGDQHAFREDFIRRFADYWQSQGRPKTEGRIVGYLLLSDREAVTAEEIADGAEASRGSVSTSIRRLEELGFVRRVRVPGRRGRLVAMDDDAWGGFLRNERDYLRCQRDLAQSALDRLPGLGPVGRSRLVNMRDYMTWLDGYHGTLLAHWEEYKARRAPANDRPA